MEIQPDTDKCDLNDGAFLAALYQENKHVLFLVARKCVDHNDDIAQDLLQTVMKKLMKKVPLLRGMDRETQCAYLVQAVRNTGAKYIHRYGMEKKIFCMGDFEEETRTVQDLAASPEEYVIRMEHMEAQKTALQSLSEKDQLLIRGKYLLDLSDQELADIMGCKEANIRVMLYRAREKAKRFLKELEGPNEG